MLAMNVQVIPGDFIRQQHRIFASFGCAGIARSLQNAAVDNEMGDMDILRL